MMYLARISNPSFRFPLLLGAVALSLTVFLFVYAVAGLAAATVFTLLVSFAGWFFGLRVGFTVVLLTLLVNTMASSLADERALIIIQQVVPGLIVLVLVSALVWWLIDLERKLKRESAERRRAEEALRQAQQHAESWQLQLTVEREKLTLLEQVVSDVSHDLKSPLSVINASIYLMGKLSDPEKQKNKLETIKSQALLLERLIQDILTSAKLDKLHELTFQPLDLNALTLNVATGFTPKAEAKNITVSLELWAGELIILANENSLHRALVNLVENALNYTPDGGNLIIASRVEGSHAITEIRDTGIGIAASDLPHIFDRFYRSGNAKSAQTGGSGLGLAITRKVIEMHGGCIEAESVYGEGTVFRVWLPRMNELRLPLDDERASIQWSKKEARGGLNWGTENKGNRAEKLP